MQDTNVADTASLPDCFVEEINTRFLFPFYFDGSKLEDARSRLCAALAREKLRLDDEERPKVNHLWHDAKPHVLYHEEMLPHVLDFLFPRERSDHACWHLQMDNAAQNSMLHDVEMRPVGGGIAGEFKVVGQAVEIFMSPQGVGLVSLTLAPVGKPSSWQAALDFNFGLARLHPLPSPTKNTGFGLRAMVDLNIKPIPASAMARLPSEKRAKMEEDEKIAAAPGLPPFERVGRRGARFGLNDVVAVLLEPLADLGLRPSQQEFSVYSVVRCNRTVNFQEPACVEQLRPFVYMLAHVEESTHAGTQHVANAILNSQHWTAVSLLGAVHVVADQTPPDGEAVHPFDQQRVGRVRDKYFVSYLVALLERLALHRALSDAAEIIKLPDEKQVHPLTDLRQSLLRYALSGHFTQVSSREALHRFYQMARQGLDLHTSWQEVRQAISDIASRLTAVEQERLASDRHRQQQQAAEQHQQLVRQQSAIGEQVSQNLIKLTKIQQIGEFLEIFIVAVYFAHLWEMFSHHGLQHVLHLSKERAEFFQPIGVVVATMVGAIAGWIFVHFIAPWLAGKGHGDSKRH